MWASCFVALTTVFLGTSLTCLAYEQHCFLYLVDEIVFVMLFQIEDGEIFASINQKDGMVCFHDNPEKYNNPAMLHNIDQEVSSLHACFALG